ncbi:MAG: glycoside hydrolase family 76 protein [Rikenellaceae bacterium]|nr:glycoside hydrolase family 76 protein [Rikenellaceae bacterium]
MKTVRFIVAILCCAWFASCAAGSGDNHNRNIERAGQTLDSLYKYYAVPGSGLLRENYPFAEDYTATYLHSDPLSRRPKEFAYLWPFSGTFSAVNALYAATGSDRYLNVIEERVLPGLEEYHDMLRAPHAYSSYINSAPQSSRYYDDNIWLGIEFTELYRTTGRHDYLSRAEEIWRFIESGRDSVLGGGIYWCEESKETKNTCSNAPAAVLALKLYKATDNPRYFEAGKSIYHWTRNRLKDPSDNLYHDNISPDGNIDRRKYSYNSGQMIQAAALLYEITGEESYLDDARTTARAVYDRFTPEQPLPDGRSYRVLADGDNFWFTAVMVRGFCELYRVDRDRQYIADFMRSLDYTWELNRDANGLFAVNSHGEPGSERWLLDQAAAVEVYARIGSLDKIDQMNK